MAIQRKPIYVETLINAPLSELWAKTQTPELHARWDIRFTDIEYLPRASEQEPQRFLYQTRIGFGMRIKGEGETVGTIEANDGARSSALKFWSADRKSLIETGSGYWKYIPTDSGAVRFLTLYDYKTRFGIVGAFFDRLIFRPIMSWGTAWSFDCLRLWLEKGLDPTLTGRQALTHLIARCAVAFVWFYHGVVPKLVFHHKDEITPVINAGMGTYARELVMVAGVLEVAMALIVIIFWKHKWPLVVTACAMVCALVGEAIVLPQMLWSAFNVVTTNVMMFVLSMIGLLTHSGLPSASHCNRNMPEGT